VWPSLLRHRHHQALPGALASVVVVASISFLDVKGLVQKQRVNKRWRKLCRKTIDAKCGQDGPKAFQSNEELKAAVKKYCNYEAANIEEIACTFGYPMDKWDVSHVLDMSGVFAGMETFSEYIGSWNVSNVTNMSLMFCRASSFNQDIGSWNVSRVTDMKCLFY
jgi:surface protein